MLGFIQHAALCLTALVLLDGGSANPRECYDLGKGEPKALVGELQYVLFPGPPNYEDVQKGDTPEPTYVLHLEQPICIQGDEFADPNKIIDAVHLVGSKATWAALRANVGRRVSVTLKDQMAANTGHHHEPLVAWVTGLTAQSRRLDFVDEYGTPATTVRAFYETLGGGHGEIASKMVVLEKRASGPFAPSNLTRFYGHLREPIRLLSIDQSGPNTFIAHYRYAASNTVCSGDALVTTVSRQGRNYIESIKALKGC